MNTFKKVLYLGAWDHIEVVNYFPNCNEFVFIDTQPRCEYIDDYPYDRLFKVNFIENIKTKFKQFDFILDNIIELDHNYLRDLKYKYPYINPHLFIFHSKSINRTIKYYISTNILFNMNEMLEKDIYEADSLYVAGYSPDNELLKYFYSPSELLNGIIKKKHFIGDNETIYDRDDNTIISINNNLDDYFDNYYLVWREKSMVIICDSLEDINNKIKKLKKNI